MNCTCIQDSETEIAKHYTVELGVAATAKACNVAFGLSTLGDRHYLPFAVKADATGYRSDKGKEVAMFFSYCPFCGVNCDVKAETPT